MEMETLNKREWIRGALAGKGSFGTVNLAVYKSTGEIFAVKSVVLSSSPSAAVASLQNEIRILQSLSSPYIVTYLRDDLTEEYSAGKCLNLHMEYIAGGTLSELGKLEERDVRAYTRCVARALLYLHNFAGVVHGDVKGRNVLVVPSGGAKLADFGSATRLTEKHSSTPQGTPLYMAPEVLRGEKQSPKSDVWSLGCTIIEMATGKQPWERYSVDVDAGKLLLRIGYGDELPELPSGFSKIGLDFLYKCLSRDPTERWSCEQLLQHPFLAEDDEVWRPSPRSVFDWASLDFEEEEDEDDQESADPEEISISASERISELASRFSSLEFCLSWDSDSGWITVREVEAESSTFAGGDDEEGIRWAYADCSGAELEEHLNFGGDGLAAEGTRCCNNNSDDDSESLLFFLNWWCAMILLSFLLFKDCQNNKALISLPFFFSFPRKLFRCRFVLPKLASLLIKHKKKKKLGQEILFLYKTKTLKKNTIHPNHFNKKFIYTYNS